MKTITTTIVQAIEAHTTELLLVVFSIPFLIAYWRTRDQTIGALLSGIVGRRFPSGETVIAHLVQATE